MEKGNVKFISLIEEEDIRKRSSRKSYDVLNVSKKEKAAFKNIKLEIFEKGLLEDYESGKTIGPHGFLIHHIRYLRTRDGKVVGLRREGGEAYKYDTPIKRTGQQRTICADCGKDILLNVDFQFGDIEKGGAYCVDCTKGHPERFFPLSILDLELRFKTVYKPSRGAHITTGIKAGILRSYMWDIWIEKDILERGDSFILFRVKEDPSGLFDNNCIFVKPIKGPIKDSEIRELLKDLIPSWQEDIDTMILKCETCGMLHKLSDQELEEVANFIIKHKLYGTDILGYMEMVKGRTCNNAMHKFKFGPEYERILFDIIKKNEAAIKERDESLTKKEKLEKERDNILADHIVKVKARDELAKKMEEINKEMGLSAIRMDEITKNIATESKNVTDSNITIHKTKERLYQLTKTSDFELWPERKENEGK